MPFAQIPLAIFAFGGAGEPSAPLAGGVLAGQWSNIAGANPPKPIECFDLYSFYIPVAVTSAYAGTLPAETAHLTVITYLSGDPVYQDNLNLSMNQFGTTNWLRANGTSTGQLLTPVRYRSGQTLGFGFVVRFDDSPVNGFVVIGGAFTDPTLPSVQTAPGSIGYTIGADELVLVP